ncbi:MAG: aminotransferase class I/II-fold pyridoxal phosphate-dependent enzyme [Lentisphaerae bacterium]|nr:aminotransferase class I/II-fold pyridoxal phosphate-dependent enzyme [Lentisphaerota bacterium]
MNPRIFLSPPWMGGGEEQRVREAFASNYIAPTGPMVDRFEALFSEAVGMPNVCALSSGTAALDLLFRELGVQRGDTVICSDLTFVASIAPAVHAGATPVFIDCDDATWTMNPRLLAEALLEAERKGARPKAVVAVDLYGQCCDYDRIEALCARHGVPLIVDAAEALGARYGARAAGDAGWASVYSFNGNKIITTSGGGMLASRDAGVVERARKRSQQSREAAVWYEHRELGYNYRLSNICAAIGVGQLAHLDTIIARKRAIAAGYQARLRDIVAISWMPEAPTGTSNRWLTILQLDPRLTRVTPEQVRLALEAENIESRPVWKPMHAQPVFAGARCHGGAVSERLFRQGLCLPSGAGLGDHDLDRVAAVVRACVASF